MMCVYLYTAIILNASILWIRLVHVIMTLKIYDHQTVYENASVLYVFVYRLANNIYIYGKRHDVVDGISDTTKYFKQNMIKNP